MTAKGDTSEAMERHTRALALHALSSMPQCSRCTRAMRYTVGAGAGLTLCDGHAREFEPRKLVCNDPAGIVLKLEKLAGIE